MNFENKNNNKQQARESAHNALMNQDDNRHSLEGAYMGESFDRGGALPTLGRDEFSGEMFASTMSNPGAYTSVQGLVNNPAQRQKVFQEDFMSPNPQSMRGDP